jgi:hypothetical protein
MKFFQFIVCLLFVTAFSYGQEDNCTEQVYRCDDSLVMESECTVVERLYLLYTESNFDSPTLPKNTHYNLVLLSLGSDPSGFLLKNGMKMDTLSYSGFINDKKMELLNTNMACLTLEVIRIKYHWIHTRIIVGSNVKIGKIGFFGFYINMRNAKELMKINGLTEIGIRGKYIKRRAKELLVENGISVKILPEGPTYYP